MKNPASQATIVAGFLALAASTGMAQLPYRADLTWNVGGTGESGGSSASATLAHIQGACNGLSAGNMCASPFFQERAGATSQPSSLSGYGQGLSTSGVSAGGSGTATYTFEDVVFTDETNPGSVVPFSTTLDFTYEGTQSGNTPFGTLFVTVQFSGTSGLVAQWVSPPLHPNGGIPLPLSTAALALETNTVYTLVISARFSGGGNSGIWERIDGSVVWNEPPFLLPANFTADSAQANITDNSRAYPVPVTTPSIITTWPLVAGAGSQIVVFQDGQPGSPGVYVVGGLPTGAPIQFDVFATYDLFPTPFFPVAFTADGNGEHVLPLVTTPALSGISLGIQAFQFVTGPPNGWYSSNPWTMTFQ